MNYAVGRVLNMKDGGDSIHFLDVEALYKQAPADSELRNPLVHLCVWEEKKKLELSPTAPHVIPSHLGLEF